MFYRTALGRPTAFLITTLALPGILFLSGEAAGQTAEEIAGARAAATEGAKAFSEGRYSDAVDMMSRAESIVHSPVQQLYMARAYVKLGKLVKSRELYLKIRREGMKADASEAVRRAVGDAEKELQQLEPRLPYVTAAVQGAGPLPVTVTVDGVAIPQALLGVPHPIDPGKHIFQAFAEGKRSQEKAIIIAEAARETVVLDLQEQPGVAAPGPSLTPGATPGAAGPDPGSSGGTGASLNPPGADSGTTSGGTNPLRIGSYVAFGVGAVGLGVGTYFFLDGGSKETDASDLFDKNKCGATPKGAACDAATTAKIQQLDSDGASAKTLGAVGLVAGGVGVAAGVILFIVSGDNDSSAASAPTVTPYIGWNSLGVTGSF